MKNHHIIDINQQGFNESVNYNVVINPIIIGGTDGHIVFLNYLEKFKIEIPNYHDEKEIKKRFIDYYVKQMLNSLFSKVNSMHVFDINHNRLLEMEELELAMLKYLPEIEPTPSILSSMLGLLSSYQLPPQEDIWNTIVEPKVVSSVSNESRDTEESILSVSEVSLLSGTVATVVSHSENVVLLDESSLPFPEMIQS
jgi:hypothetical protein